MQRPVSQAQADFAAALLDPQAACPPQLAAWNGSNPSRRLAIHRNNVLASLSASLADSFPVVQALVGDEFFQAMATVYLRQHPPRVRVLAQHGADFAAFIAAFPPARTVPYLADVARLEQARVRAWHAADAPALAPSTAQAALAVGDRAGELQLICHPGVSVLDSAYAVVSIWAAHQGPDEPSGLDPDAPESALVLREEQQVLVMRLSAGDSRFIAALLQGADLADAAGQASNTGPGFDLAAAIALLMQHGALTDIRLP